MNLQGSAIVSLTEKQSEVSQEFAVAEERASYVEKLVDELEAKLSQSILAHRMEDGIMGTNNPEPVRVPVAQRLYELSGILGRIQNHLSSILSRIEA